ncbi:hypothetical protein DY000_02033700 [Brassica cretica]|uniref:Uncharacterized protein n=1 Tax=Brassica cretica TaxID=69181 RepID=A0ABQ7DJ47_BRACR|nr:hypothetical protein DY000_02033700 [Brassica cretica]
MGPTSPERHREVVVTPLQSDTPMSLAFSSLGGTRATLPERCGEVARVFIARRYESDVSQ